MTFGHPYFLLLLLLLPVLGWLKGKQGKPPAFVYSSVLLVRGFLNVTRTRSGALLAALRWLILAVLIIALAQPRLTKSETKISASGLSNSPNCTTTVASGINRIDGGTSKAR